MKASESELNCVPDLHYSDKTTKGPNVAVPTADQKSCSSVLVHKLNTCDLLDSSVLLHLFSVCVCVKGLSS